MTDDTSPIPRRDELLSWLIRQGLNVGGLSQLPGDVSLRRYVRVDIDGGTAIVALYPTEIRPACRNFLQTTRMLSAAGVRVPRVLASACDQGLVLLEDLGSDTLYDLRDTTPSNLSTYFWRASADLQRIQSVSVDEVEPLNPPLDRDLLWRELSQTWTSLFEPRGLVADAGFSRRLQETLTEICALLDAEPPVPCHRDFMTRNLIPVEPYPELAVIDHQDLRLGPRYYDLASLLNDSLFPSDALEEEILLHCLGAEPAERALYHRAAAQRTLKATGTYETFALRGFKRHQNLISGTLGRALRHLRRLPEADEVCDELEERLTPLLIC